LDSFSIIYFLLKDYIDEKCAVELFDGLI
jgi:hypothetical protein